MPIAFKEWAVTVRALAEGEQLVTLRKGGIREENKHFEVEHDRFFLYPTFDHQRNDLVRASHHPELRRALEESVCGRPLGERALHATPETTTPEGVPFSESRMAAHLGAETVLIDVSRGARGAAAALASSLEATGCDLLVCVD